MTIKASDIYQTTGKELPIHVVNPAGGEELEYTDPGQQFRAGDWPLYRQSIPSAVERGLIEPAKDGA